MHKPKSQPTVPPPVQNLVHGLFGPVALPTVMPLRRGRRRKMRNAPSFPATLTEPMLIAGGDAYRLSIRMKLAPDAAVRVIYKTMRETTLVPRK
jgi:hypothetical protein